MKHTTTTTRLVLFACLLVSSITYSQTTRSRHSIGGTQTSSSSNIIEKYGREYEVLNHDFNGDSTILNGINPLTVNYFRKATEDVVITDRVTSLQVLIYSIKRIEEANLNRQEVYIQID